MHGSRRAVFHAGGILAVMTGVGPVEPALIPLYRVNSPVKQACRQVMPVFACYLAGAAANAAVLVEDEFPVWHTGMAPF